MPTILFFGDSLTAGYGLQNPAKESLPGLIATKLAAVSPDYEVVNAGLSGDTSAGGLSRIDYWISRPIDIFVLELGVNDIIRGISPQVTQKNLQAIINKVKTKYPQIKLALMGMRLPPFLHSPVASQFNAIYPTLATANQMELLPFYLEGVAGISHLNLRDKMHPSAEGYKVVANNVWPVIEKLITACER
jgi:acyl-CoA thioesterase-1